VNSIELHPRLQKVGKPIIIEDVIILVWGGGADSENVSDDGSVDSREGDGTGKIGKSSNVRGDEMDSLSKVNISCCWYWSILGSISL